MGGYLSTSPPESESKSSEASSLPPPPYYTEAMAGSWFDKNNAATSFADDKQLRGKEKSEVANASAKEHYGTSTEEMQERKRLQEESDLAFAQALQAQEEAAARATTTAPSLVGPIDNRGYMETIGNDYRNGPHQARSSPLVGAIRNTGTMIGVGNDYSRANIGGGGPFYSASGRAPGFSRQVPGGSGRLTGA